MKLEFEPTITKQYLLDRASQETYLEYYLGIPVKKGLFKSPLRADNNPTLLLLQEQEWRYCSA